MPGSVINVETVLDEFAAVAIVNLGPHYIGEAHLLAAQFREWQKQAALPLVAGIIDDDEMVAAVLAGPGEGDKAIKGPIARPGGQRLDLRPGAVAKGAGPL